MTIRACLLAVACLLASCGKDGSDADTDAALRAALRDWEISAPSRESLYAMGWQSLAGSVALLDDDELGDSARRYAELCAALWGHLPHTVAGDEPRSHLRQWFARVEASGRAVRGFNCRPEEKPVNLLVIESQLAAPEQ